MKKTKAKNIRAAIKKVAKTKYPVTFACENDMHQTCCGCKCICHMIPTSKRDYRIRHVNFFRCAKCGNPAESKKRRNAEAHLCRKCRCGEAMNPNQTKLFDQPEVSTGRT